MATRSTRKLGIRDAMVLIAATAVGLAVFPLAFDDYFRLGTGLSASVIALTTPQNGSTNWAWAFYDIYGHFAAILLPFCWAWTIALAGLHLIGPRPGASRLRHQPGANACVSATIAYVCASIILCLILALSSPRVESFESDVHWSEFLPIWSVFFVPPLIGFAVLGSWLFLVFGRSWRPERSWIDLAGRLLGVYWIGTIILPIWVYFHYLRMNHA